MIQDRRLSLVFAILFFDETKPRYHVISRVLRHRRRWLLPRRVRTLLLTQAHDSADVDQFPWFPHWILAGVFLPGISFRGLSRAGLRVSIRAIHSPQLIAYHRLLPEPNPSFIPSRPFPNYPPAHEVSHHPTPSDFRGQSLQIPRQPVQYCADFFNPQDSGPMRTVMPTTHQPPATLDAGCSSMYNGFQGCSSAVSKFLHFRAWVACLCSIPTV